MMTITDVTYRRIHFLVGILLSPFGVHGFLSFSRPIGPRCQQPISPSWRSIKINNIGPAQQSRSVSSVVQRFSQLRASTSKSPRSNWDESGKCKFGNKAYWDSVYTDEDANGADKPSETYSWYCGYGELKPFWNMLIDPVLIGVGNGDDEKAARCHQDEIQVLVVGIGNDRTPVELYDDGWTNMVAFDYSQAGVDRARELFGTNRSKVDLLLADARQLPLQDGSVNVVFDKGTLDTIYISGWQELQDSIKELTRVTDTNGVFVCVSAVIPPETLLKTFEDQLDWTGGGDKDEKAYSCWDTILNGDLAFAPDGEATLDLGAQLYAFRRRNVSDRKKNCNL